MEFLLLDLLKSFQLIEIALFKCFGIIFNPCTASGDFKKIASIFFTVIKSANSIIVD